MGCNCGRRRAGATSAQNVIHPTPDATPESIAATVVSAGSTKRQEKANSGR